MMAGEKIYSSMWKNKKIIFKQRQNYISTAFEHTLRHINTQQSKLVIRNCQNRKQKLLKKKTKIWEWYPGGILKSEWTGDPIVQNLLETGRIHLTQERAQTWADWWENTVINN